MSFVAIITGLLIWLSVPQYFAKKQSADTRRLVKLACMIVGAACIVGGILWNYIK